MPFRSYPCCYKAKASIPSLYSRILLICSVSIGLLAHSVQADEPSLEADLREGKRSFSIYCAQCHGIGGAGGGHSRNGPSLTDSISIYGDQLTDIIRVISEGVPRAAMPQWKQKMAPDRIRKLAVYVDSIRGTQIIRKSSREIHASIQKVNTSDSIKQGKRKLLHLNYVEPYLLPFPQQFLKSH